MPLPFPLNRNPLNSPLRVWLRGNNDFHGTPLPPPIQGAWRLNDGTLDAWKLNDGSDDAWLLNEINDQRPTFATHAWYAADLSAKTFNGPNVSVWGDISGNGRDATQTLDVNQPLFVENAINGRPTMRYDGSNDFFDLPTATTLGIVNVDYEITIVALTSLIDVQMVIAGATGTNYEVEINGLPFADVGARFIPRSLVFADIGLNGDFSDGFPHIFSARVAANVGIIRVDSVDSGITAATARSPDTGALTLGRRTTGAFPVDGDIAEVIISPVLTNGERATLDSYLSSKYGT